MKRVMLSVLGGAALSASVEAAPRRLEDCPAQVSLSQLEATTQGVMQAYRDRVVGDSVAMRNQISAAALELEQQLPCVSERIPAQLAADIHLTMGLAAFLQRDRDGAKGAFGASRSARGAGASRPDVIPDDLSAALRQSYDALPQAPVSVVPMPEVVEGRGVLVLDGSLAEDRPGDRPTVFQYEDGDRILRVSAYLRPGSELPAYPAVTALPDGPSPRRRAARLTLGAGLAMWAGAGIAGGIYYRNYSVFGCSSAGGDLTCSEANDLNPGPDDYTTDQLYSTVLRPASIAGWTAFGLGAGLLGTSTALFVSSRPGRPTSVGLTLPW